MSSTIVLLDRIYFTAKLIFKIIIIEELQKENTILDALRLYYVQKLQISIKIQLGRIRNDVLKKKRSFLLYYKNNTSFGIYRSKFWFVVSSKKIFYFKRFLFQLNDFTVKLQTVPMVKAKFIVKNARIDLL